MIWKVPRPPGVDGIGAVYGCGSEEELRKAGADRLVSDADALRELLCPSVPAPRGFFLSLEGPDGAGKTHAGQPAGKKPAADGL